LGNYSEALISVRQAKTLETNGYRSELMEARLLIRLNQYSEALEILTRLMKTNEQSPQISFSHAIANLNQFFHSKQRIIPPMLFDLVRKGFLKSIGLDPSNMFFMEEYILFLNIFGKKDEANKYKQKLKLLKSSISI